MRKRVFVAISMVLLLLVTVSYADGPRTVRVAAFNYFPGIFKDTDGVVKGFYIDALADIAVRENIRFEYVYGTWADGLERIKSGEVDLLTSVAYTPERATFLDFSKTPLLTVWGELYVPLSSDIDGISDVHGKKIAVMSGDFNAKYFINLVQKFDIACEFVELPGFDDVFKAVVAKKVDAGVVSSTFGVAKHEASGLRSTGVVFNPFEIYFAVAAGKNQDLLALMDNYLISWRHKADSPYNKARQKWSHGASGILHVIPRWLVNSLAALAVLVLVATSFIVLLRRQVRRATTGILQSKAVLLESELSYRTLADSGQALIWKANTDKLCDYFNKIWLDFTGRTLEQELGNGWTEGVHPDDYQYCLDIYLSAFDKHESFSMDYRLLRHDGEYRWIQDDGCPRFDVNGTFAGYIGYCLDITERKIAEKELQALSLRQNAILAAIPDIIMEVNPQKIYTWSNSAGLEFFGDDVVGREASYYFVGEQNTYELIKPLLRGTEDIVYVESWQKRNDGEIRLLSWWCKLMVDEHGATIGVLSSARDITENRRIQDALQKQVVALTQPLDNPDGIKFTDLFSIEEIQKIQDAFAQATGVASIITAPDGTPITRPGNFCRLCNEIIRTTEKGLANCLRSDAALGCYNSTGPTIQPCLSGGLWDAGASISVGGRHIANWLIGQVRNEEQNVSRMMSYADEIGVNREKFSEALAEVPVMTKERFEKVAQALYSFASELSLKAYQNVQQARFIADRKQYEKELMVKNAELESFTYTVSHDLKSPLITIKSFSGSIKRDLAIGRNDRVGTDLERIETAADKMAALLDDLLALSRVGRVVNASEPVAMKELVEELLRHLAGLLNSKGVQTDVATDLPTFLCDRQRMAEVVQNLVENAVKYMGAQPEPRIVFGMREAAGETVFFVQDNGIGIDESYHQTVFGLFNQLDAKSSGTGIGLALVKRIVEVHGGRVWVESQGSGTGSSFCIAFAKG